MEYLVADGLRPGIGRFGSCTKSNNRFGSWSIYKYVPSIKSMVSPTRNWSIVHVPTRMKCIVTNMFIYNHPLIFHKWTHIMLSQINVLLPTTVLTDMFHVIYFCICLCFLITVGSLLPLSQQKLSENGLSVKKYYIEKYVITLCLWIFTVIKLWYISCCIISCFSINEFNLIIISLFLTIFSHWENMWFSMYVFIKYVSQFKNNMKRIWCQTAP